ncbi:GNAT family N-acetyltransferase [Geofilum rubicundum]|uniref:N-acetylneuraminate cytidylyltransferase n=1 Tax=Geofilum rubicundum JCM 15548 TaxID=1236989 RepID=A0A0E9LZB3_9BACT|nr:GNAT family N-acetyltransferase [Geofilum rubicundum]GAO30461.1 N-acetylneuraminate cytidylyltransferase [Geofilum rubicundum JCM 15548]
MSLKFRHANIEDAELLFNWVNDPIVRAASFYNNLISWTDHINWFENKLEDEKTQILIFEFEGVPAGQIRIENKETAIIGVSIDKNFRGKKLAVEMLRNACTEFWKIENKPLFAYIKKENLASIKAFKNAGFSYLMDDKINNSDCVIYKANNITINN